MRLVALLLAPLAAPRGPRRGARARRWARTRRRAPTAGCGLLEWAGRAGGLAPGQGALVTTARGGLRLAWRR